MTVFCLFISGISSTSELQNPHHIWTGECSTILDRVDNKVRWFVTCVFYVSSVHVVFGHVISGQEVVQTMENQKTDPNSRPYAEVKVLNCGELVPKSKGLRLFFFFLKKLLPCALKFGFLCLIPVDYF